MNETDNLEVKVIVKNIGSQTGHETVLLFIYQMYRRVTPEYKLLKRFKKVLLHPEQSNPIMFTLTKKDFEYVGLEHRCIWKNCILYI